MSKTITFHCQHCGNKITTAVANVGKKGTCTGCRTQLVIPNISAGVQIDEGTSAKGSVLSTLPLIFGIISLLVIPYFAALLGVGFGIAGLIRGKSDRNRKLCIAGMGLSLIGAAAAVYLEAFSL